MWQEGLAGKKSSRQQEQWKVFTAHLAVIVAVWLGFEIYSLTAYVIFRATGVPMDLGYNAAALEANNTRVSILYNAFSGIGAVYVFYLMLIVGAVLLLFFAAHVLVSGQRS